MVSQRFSVLKRLERPRMLCNAGYAEIRGRRPERKHEVLVGLHDTLAGEHVMITNRAAGDVDLVHIGEDELRARKLGADRRDHVTHFEFARGDLGKHRRKEAVVLAAEQNDLGFPVPQSPLEAPGDGNSGKSAPDDHDDRHAMRLKRVAWNTFRRRPPPNQKRPSPCSGAAPASVHCSRHSLLSY